MPKTGEMDFSDPEPPSPALVRADPVERIFAPQTLSRFAERTRLTIFFAVFLAAHIGLLAFVLIYGFEDPPPPEQEIAVEIVPPPEQQQAEQPPPPPPPQPEQEQPKQEEAKKPPPDLDLTPAQDAPRAENKETVDRKAPDKETSVQRVAPPTEQGTKGDSQDKPSDARSTPAPVEGPLATRAAEEKPDAEATEYAEQKPDATAERSASPEQKPESGANIPTIAQMMARLEPVPDYKIAGAAKPSPLAGGTAKPNYLSIIFATVMPRFRRPTGVTKVSKGQIQFIIDTRGYLLHAGQILPSGSPALDSAAMAALRASVPFPPPPAGLPSLTWTYE